MKLFCANRTIIKNSEARQLYTIRRYRCAPCFATPPTEEESGSPLPTKLVKYDGKMDKQLCRHCENREFVRRCLKDLIHQ